MHDLLHDVTHEFLHVDSKIFRTVKLLLLKPGFLTREYFEGRRVRYVSPLRVYLVFSVIYFAAATSIERPIFRSDENVEVGALGAALGLEDTSPEEANRLMADVQAHWIPRLMFVLMPIRALVVQLATRRTKLSTTSVLRPAHPRGLLRAAHGHRRNGAIECSVARCRRFVLWHRAAGDLYSGRLPSSLLRRVGCRHRQDGFRADFLHACDCRGDCSVGGCIRRTSLTIFQGGRARTCGIHGDHGELTIPS
jgi:Protein of unknown function (DUF3667)